ncbi:MAG: hypothetical protein MJH09_01425 [Cetobacterium sp.]|nr:hypothetical protein [Cetobacterium sp.]
MKKSRLDILLERSKETQKLIIEEKKKEEKRKRNELTKCLKYSIEYHNFFEIYDKPELIYGLIKHLKERSIEGQEELYLNSLEMAKKDRENRKRSRKKTENKEEINNE